MRRMLLAFAVAASTVAALASQAGASPAANEGPAVAVSGASPIGGCDGDQPGSGINFPNSEVEPWMAVNPTNGNNLVAAWQQDRWNNGGSEGIVTASSSDGGGTWTTNATTKSSICTGGTAANGGLYERSSDPWVDFSPNGTAYLMTLSVDTNPGGFGTSPNAMLVMRSTNGGASWSDPITLKRDENPNVLNDKNTLTADRNDSNFVYAVWDRLVRPERERESQHVRERDRRPRADLVLADNERRQRLGAGPDHLRAGHEQPDHRQPDRRAPRQRAVQR